MSSHQAVDQKMYLAVQCVHMDEALLRELVEGPAEEWREPARMELERRASPITKTVFGIKMSPND